MKSAISVFVCISIVFSQTVAYGQASEEFWAKYEGGFPGVTKKSKGRLAFDNERRVVIFLKGGKKELFAIPYDTITVISADETARRRVKETVILGVALIGLFALPILFSKKKLKYVLIEYRDPSKDTAGGAVFQVKQKDMDGVLALVAEKGDLVRKGDVFARADIEIEERTQVEETKEKPTKEKAREKKSDKKAMAEPCIVEVGSAPPAADVEVDGKFVGNTPTTLKLTPGDYEVAVKKAGYKPWKRTVSAVAGNALRLFAELEKEE